MRRDRRALRRLAGLAVVMVAIAGCGALPASMVARVPTSGPIEQGAQIAAQGEDQFIRVIARGPREGMTREEVVRGFLDASASFDGDHAVARQYLSAEGNRTWNPAAGVLVYEGIGAIEATGEVATLSGVQSGRISSIGRYAVAPPNSQIRAEFALEQVDGEWRIRQAPSGLVLSLADVDRSFRSQSVYFFDPSFSVLVPDPRMLPVSGGRQATALVQYLIDGPSVWLAPAVRNGFPKGVDLTVDSVPIDANGVASVDLTTSVLLTSDEVRKAISAQLVWTLGQLPDVKAVSITAAGQPLSVPRAASPQQVGSWPQVDPDRLATGSSGFAVSEGRVVRLVDEADPAPVPGGAGDQGAALVDLAVTRESDAVAGLDRDGAVWWARLADGEPLVRLGEQVGWSAPAFDRSGAVWVVDRAGQVTALRPDGEAAPVEVSGLPLGSVLRQVVPARDGTRAAMLVRRGSATELFLGRIVRPDLAGAAVVEEPIRVEAALTNVSDVAWADAETLAALGNVEAGAPEVYAVDIARGLTSGAGAPQSPVALAAAPGLPALVTSADGVLFRSVAGVWLDVTTAIAPAYPG